MSSIQKPKLECPIAISWSISENRLRKFMNRPGEHLISDWYIASNIPGVQYYLKFFPNDDERQGQTWIYLYLKYSKCYKIKSNIMFKLADHYFFDEYIFEKSKGRGTKCCAPNQLLHPDRRFIVNGKLTIELEGTLMVETEMPEKTQSYGRHADLLCIGLWNQEETKDFTIMVDEKEILAHKLILATRSPVFGRMFQSGMKESEENKVVITDFSFKIVEAAIKSCYHQSLLSETILEDSMDILQFYDKYDIQPLKDDLESSLISEINISTVCRLANASLLSNALKLKQKCTEFLQNCLHRKTSVNDLDLLDKDYVLELFKNSFS